MPSPGETAKIKAEIVMLEKALLDCIDSEIRKVIEYWIDDARERLASAKKSK
jgi:hypothetical protein